MSSKTTQIEENDDRVDPVQNESTDTAQESAAEVETAATSEGDNSPEQVLEEAQATIKEYWDQIMRLRAEMENNRKRAERDVENAHKYALKNFTEALLPVIDSMEMGITAASADNATLQSIREGSELTLSIFMQVLEKHGLAPINPVGEAFDPEQHQAISMVEDDKAESNSVISVMQKGFVLNDRLVRPAMVVVAK